MAGPVKAAKAVKTAPARRAAKAAPPPVPVHSGIDDVPDELRDFYTRPALRGDGDGGGYAPLVLSMPTRKQQRAVEKEPLFYLDGTEYGIPKRFPPALSLLYLDGIEEGRDVALGRVLKSAIGEVGWGALMEYVKAGGEIGEQAMAGMLGHVLKKVLGAMEADGEGNG